MWSAWSQCFCLTAVLANPNKCASSCAFTMPESMSYTGLFDDLFKEYTKTYKLKRVKTSNMGSLFQLQYDIVLKDETKEKEMIDQIKMPKWQFGYHLRLYIGRKRCPLGGKNEKDINIDSGDADDRPVNRIKRSAPAIPGSTLNETISSQTELTVETVESADDTSDDTSKTAFNNDYFIG